MGTIRQGRRNKPRPNTMPRHKPRFEGEIVENLYCPAGHCKQRHAKAVAKMMTFEWADKQGQKVQKSYLCWVFKGACLEKISKQVLEGTVAKWYADYR